MIEERAVAVGRGAQPGQVLREELGVIAVDLRHPRDQLGHVAVMRQRMVRLGHANLRIGPGALLLADHERDHARQVRLEREQLQVEHQLQVILEDRRHARRLVHVRQIEIPLRLGALDSPLDVANRLGELVDLRLILRPERRA